MIYFLIILFTLIIIYLLNEFRKPLNYPPGPQWLPIVGNTSQLRHLTKILGGQHKVFEKWSQDFNSSVIGLKLGKELFVVGLTYPIVREIHTNEVFDGRPDTFFLRLRTMGKRLGITCTDGEIWSEHRSFATKHLRQAGFGRQPMKIQIQRELDDMIELINDHKQPVYPGNIFASNVINVLWTFTAGKRYARDDEQLIRLLNLMKQRSKAFDMSGGLLNQMPWLRFLMPEKTGFNLINKLNQELRDFFMVLIEEHKKSYTADKMNDDLIYAFIHEMILNESESGDISTFTDDQLTMIILDMFIAGSQTTSTTIDLALMATVMFPEIQNKLHDEIDRALGRKENPSYENRHELPYVEAFLLEVHRFFHILPITGPRRALNETSLGGYRIPKNTTILIGLYSVHMDANIFDAPNEFRPERFLNAANEIINTEYVMPFGQGRRRCLGDQLAKACIFTFFVGLLQKYKLRSNETDKPLRVLTPGLILTPKPYNVYFEPR